MGQWGHQLVKKSKDLISIAFENITKERQDYKDEAKDKAKKIKNK